MTDKTTTDRRPITEAELEIGYREASLELDDAWENAVADGIEDED